MFLLNVRLSRLLPREEFIAAFMVCIAMDRASLMYFLALAISWGFFCCSAHISDVTLLGVILDPGICERSKQTNKKQTTIMTCVFGLESWLGILDRYIKCFKLMWFSTNLNIP
jgi:hypothetical protein